METEVKDMSYIRHLTAVHEEYQSRCLPLIASENATSKDVNEAVSSDLNHRYAEGLPGKRHYPGKKWVDDIELASIGVMKNLFNATKVDLRPLSGTQANLIVYTAFTNPGDTIMRMPTGKGGHISSGSRRLGGTAGTVRRLDAATFAFDEDEFNIDVDESVRIYKGLEKVGKRPKIILFGASIFLFPHPVRLFVDEIGLEPIIVYDAAHVAGLIAGGEFQNPFLEGADIITMSTHKTFFGPQHGAILMSNKYIDIHERPSEELLWKKIQRAVFPANVSNHHLGNMAGVGIAAEEMLDFGRDYAKQVIKNARTLGASLAALGYNIVGEDKGYTQSHMILLDAADIGGGKRIESYLENVGILANRNLLPWDRRFGCTVWNPSGIRIGVQEVTRLGFKEEEIKITAGLIHKAIIKKGCKRIGEEVAEMINKYRTVKYCFGGD